MCQGQFMTILEVFPSFNVCMIRAHFNMASCPLHSPCALIQSQVVISWNTEIISLLAWGRE